MGDSYVALAPDSTGKKMRARSRTIGANTVHEHYAIASKAPVVTTRAWVASFRQLVPRAAIGAASTFSQPAFTVWNGGSNIVSVRRITVEIDSVVGKATGVIMPILRLYRTTAAPTGGTGLSMVQQDTADAAFSSINIEARGDASADGTNSGTALSAVASPVTPMWEQTFPSWGTTTLAGYMQPAVMTLAPDDTALQAEDPLYLRPSQGLALITQGASATYGAGDWSLHVKAVVAEFTIP